MPYKVRRDYHAVHSSGHRRLEDIRHLVLHDMEVTLYKEAAEAVGRYFEMGSSGGSTHYGVDNDSIQQYLPIDEVCWGAPNANFDGVHIEQMGRADWSTSEWKRKAEGTLDRTAWLLARLSKRLSIPLTKMTDTQLRNNAKGVTTHRQVTKVLHGGTHTDPGSGYPFDYVLRKARAYKAQM
jgi:hypothetical protein